MNAWSMTQFAATVAACTGIEAPMLSAAPLKLVVDYATRQLHGYADRLLVYNPDCIGQWLWQKHTDIIAPAQLIAPLAVPLSTVMPAVTPVCFGTMYTGAPPEVHGIQTYAKPVIRIDSLFDSLTRSQKRVALIAVKGSSMAAIFAGRKIDYHILPDDGAVICRALELINDDRYDAIFAYNQAYDDAIHATSPESEMALEAARAHVAAFARLAEQVDRSWRDHRALLCWAPDHGCHLDHTGHGDHGELCEEDINVIHLFGAYSAH